MSRGCHASSGGLGVLFRRKENEWLRELGVLGDDASLSRREVPKQMGVCLEKNLWIDLVLIAMDDDEDLRCGVWILYQCVGGLPWVHFIKHWLNGFVKFGLDKVLFVVNNRALSVGALVRRDELHISLAVNRRCDGIGGIGHSTAVKDLRLDALKPMRRDDLFEGGSCIHSTSTSMNKDRFNGLLGSNIRNKASRSPSMDQLRINLYDEKAQNY